MRRGPARGATMLEALTAGAVLVLGLTGITIMLKASSGATRDAVVSQNAVIFSSAALEERAAYGYCGLSAGTSDGGVTFDGTGRRYGRRVGITAGGSVTIPTYTITVQTEWTDSLGAPRTTTLTTLVSRLSDAGC